MNVLIADPAAVRQAAAHLAAQAASLDAHADTVARAAGDLSAQWHGAASMAFDGAAAGVRRGAATAATDLRTLADAARTYADRMSTLTTDLTALAARERRALDELTTLEATQATQVAALRPDDLARARAHVESAAAAVQDAVQRQQLAARDLAQTLDASDPGAAIPAALGSGVMAAWQTKGYVQDGLTVLRQAFATGTLWHSAAILQRVARAAAGAPLLEGGRAARTVAEATQRSAAAIERLHGGPVRPGTLGVARSVIGKVGLGATVVSGLHDLIHGDPDHPGLRSAATRALGGAGAAGGLTLLANGAGVAAVGGPVTLAIAGTAVTAYGAWKLGTAIYDNREAVGRGARAAVRFASDGARAATREAGRRLAEAGREVGRRVDEGTRQVRDAVNGVAERAESFRRALSGPFARFAG